MAARPEFFGPVPVVAGYVPAIAKLTVSQQLGAVQGAGARRVVVPAGHWWRIISAQATYVTSATVANRTFELIVRDAVATTLLDVFSPAAQTASQTVTYAFGPEYQNLNATIGATAFFQTFTIPDLLWPGGTLLDMAHTAVAGDAWSTPAPFFLIEDYVEVGQEATAGATVAPPIQL